MTTLTMARWLIAGALVACACPNKPGPTGGGGSNGSGSGAATACDGIRAKVERMYRAEAQEKEPKRVDETVADNTTMVMNDCAKAPDKVAPCVNGASTVAAIEKCLAPLDDEGREGEELRR